MNPSRVLILPGWQGSGPQHWQSRWERLHGYQRVEQHDWQRPLRGDWTARLEDVLLASTEPADPADPTNLGQPAVVVAHSLGCIQLAWWAAHSRHTGRVKAALLVAPPDIGREDLRQRLPGWAPVARQRLPFPSVLVASSDDPYGSLGHARRLACDWGSALHQLGPLGHINADSGLGDWQEGHALLLDWTGSSI